jgi:hypothetical protein
MKETWVGNQGNENPMPCFPCVPKVLGNLKYKNDLKRKNNKQY